MAYAWMTFGLQRRSTTGSVTFADFYSTGPDDSDGQSTVCTIGTTRLGRTSRTASPQLVSAVRRSACFDLHVTLGAGKLTLKG